MALVRIPLALQPAVVAELDELATDQHASRTEAIRRSIAMYRWFIREHKAGNRIATIAPDGTVTPREFLIV